MYEYEKVEQYEKQTQERIAALCLSRNVSERKVSNDLGHSDGYLNSITRGRALPAMKEFFYICEYFNITPKEFFEDGSSDPAFLRELIADLKRLDAKQLEHLSALVKTMLK